jgi:hypothetical protein
MRFACVWVLAAGCADPGEQVTGATLVTVADVDGVVTVTGPGYSMGFAADGVRMPSRFVVDGQETFGNDTDVCARESNAGIGLIPAVNANSETQGQIQSTLVRRLDGPLVAKIDVTYEVAYSCDDALQTLSGTSHFSFFPSGRIVRFDEHVVPASDTLPPSAACGCQNTTPPGAYTFTSYWAFSPTGAIQANGFGEQQAKGAVVGNACTIYSDRAIAVNPDTEGKTRLSPHDAASHVFEFDSAVTSLTNEERFLFSALQVSTADSLGVGNCTDLVLQLVDEPLVIGDEEAAPTASDGINAGIYVGKMPHPAKFEIELPAGGTIVPGGFAVAVNLGGATRGTVTKNPPIDRDGPVAFTQTDDQGNTLFYFPEPLEPAQTITIEPIF